MLTDNLFFQLHHAINRSDRAEEAAAAGQTTLINDCEVSAWRIQPDPDRQPDIGANAPAPASAADCFCSDSDFQKGTRVFSVIRDVVTAPTKNLGAACPVLTLKDQTCECAERKDCQLSEWSDWSTCSAECSGGVPML